MAIINEGRISSDFRRNRDPDVTHQILSPVSYSPPLSETVEQRIKYQISLDSTLPSFAKSPLFFFHFLFIYKIYSTHLNLSLKNLIGN
jgi:hypothetical protein